MALDMHAKPPEPNELDEDGAAPRHTFEVYIDDSRYTVPTLYLIAANEAGAIEAAQRMLADSPHHLGAELCLDGRRLIGFGTFATRRAGPGEPAEPPPSPEDSGGPAR